MSGLFHIGDRVYYDIETGMAVLNSTTPWDESTFIGCVKRIEGGNVIIGGRYIEFVMPAEIGEHPLTTVDT